MCSNRGELRIIGAISIDLDGLSDEDVPPKFDEEEQTKVSFWFKFNGFNKMIQKFVDLWIEPLKYCIVNRWFKRFWRSFAQIQRCMECDIWQSESVIGLKGATFHSFSYCKSIEMPNDFIQFQTLVGDCMFIVSFLVHCGNLEYLGKMASTSSHCKFRW